MTEPKRWIDEGPPEAIDRLLRAASAEKPPEAGMARTLGVLGIGLGTAGAASTATASTAGASAAGSALGAASVGKASGVFAAGTIAKWGLVVTVVTAAGVAGKVATTHRASAPAAQVAAQVQAPVQTIVASKPARPGPEIVPLVPLAASAGPVAVEARAVARPSTASSLPKAAFKGEVAAASVPEAPIDVERLNEEVALVDQARGALARGDARAAISALDDYDARFSARRFVPEALYLRMESLLRLNQSAAARAVASRLATGYPSSPHAARARQVLEQRAE